MRVILTPDDLKKGDLLEPSWYSAEISNYSEEKTKGTIQKPSDGSMNAIFHFKIIDGVRKGVELKRYFNEKALGFGKNLYKTLDFPKTGDGGYDLSTDLFKKAVGAKLKIYIKRGIATDGSNKEFNEVADFMPMTQTAPVAGEQTAV